MNNTPPPPNAGKSKFAKIKTGFARRKQEVFTKLGKAEETVDEHFNSLKTKMVDQDRRLQKLGVDLEKYLEALKVMCDAQKTLAEDIDGFFDEPELSAKNNSLVKDINYSRIALDESIHVTFTSSLKRYCSQFPKISERIREREKRKLDMDRYVREVKTLSDKNSKDTEKLNRLEQKLKIARKGYQNINEELLKDIPHLYDDRLDFVNHLLAFILKGQTEFFQSIAEKIAVLSPELEQYDTNNLLEYPFAITPDNESAYYNYVPPSLAKAGFKEEKNKPRSLSVEKEEKLDISEESESKDLKSSLPDPFPTKTDSSHSSNRGSFTNEEPNEENKLTKEESSSIVQSEFPPTVQNDDEAPSRPPPKPPKEETIQPFKAKALFDFEKNEENELNFKENDILLILKAKGHWWLAELNGQRGMIPSNYVEKLPT